MMNFVEEGIPLDPTGDWLLVLRELGKRARADG